MEIQIDGMSVIITGGTRGIGAGIAEVLSTQGAQLTLGYLSDDKAADALKGRLEGTGGSIELSRGDLTDPKNVEALVKTAFEKFGQVDALVSNLGPFLWREISAMSVEDWDNMVASNLSQHFYLVRELLPGMKEHGSGNFVFIGGVGSGQITGHPRASVYNASKVGLAEFMRTLAVEEGPNGIRSNMIAPGIIDNGEYTDGFKDRIVDEIPLRFVGQPEDIGNAVLWLLSGASRYVNGAVIDVSGGYHLTMR